MIRAKITIRDNNNQVYLKSISDKKYLSNDDEVVVMLESEYHQLLINCGQQDKLNISTIHNDEDKVDVLNNEKAQLTIDSKYKDNEIKLLKEQIDILQKSVTAYERSKDEFNEATKENIILNKQIDDINESLKNTSNELEQQKVLVHLIMNRGLFKRITNYYPIP